MKFEKNKKITSPEKAIKDAYFPKSVSPDHKKHSNTSFAVTGIPGLSNLTQTKDMSYNQVIDILNQSDDRTTTMNEKSWKFFGPK